MKKTILAILLLAVFVEGFIIYQRRTSEKTPVNSQASQTSNTQQWETKTDDQASVGVAVTPLDISAQSKEWDFSISMNTHSVELDQNMVEASTLVSDDGKEYKPLAWNGPTGGHHRSGTLAFAPVLPYPQHLTMKISGVGEVNRSFNWTL